MANLTLLTPTTDYEAEYREMLADWQHSQDSILSLVKKLDTKKSVVKGDFTAAPATAVRTRQA